MIARTKSLRLAWLLVSLTACGLDSLGGDGSQRGEWGTSDPPADAGEGGGAAGSTVDPIADPAGFGVLSAEVIAPADFVEVGARVFFTAMEGPEEGASRSQLWVTDGTRSGTRRLLALGSPDSPRGSILQLTASSTRLFFFADGPAPMALWVSDGSAEGTRRLQEVVDRGQILAVEGDRIFFVARASTADEGELWVSDGTEAGTFVIADGGLGFWFFAEAEVARFWSGLLFFFGGFTDDVVGTPALYATDGTPESLQQLTPEGKRGVLGDYDMLPFDGHLYFTWTNPEMGTELWRTDAGGGNPVVFANLGDDRFSPTPSHPHAFVDIGDALLFATSTGLWRTDGSVDGTQRLVDVEIHPTEGGFVEAGGRWYFAASSPGDRQHPGWELWSTDGTAAGTSLVSDRVRASVMESTEFIGRSPQMVDLGARVLFKGGDENFPAAPWSSDGTDAGTVRLLDAFFRGNYTSRFTVSGDKAYFVADISPVGGEDKRLFETDGTVAGTREVAPSNAAQSTNPLPFPSPPARAGEILVFGAKYTEAGHVLWSFRPPAQTDAQSLP